MILTLIVSLLRETNERLTRLERKVNALTIRRQCVEHEIKHSAIIKRQEMGR